MRTASREQRHQVEISGKSYERRLEPRYVYHRSAVPRRVRSRGKAAKRGSGGE